MFLLLTFCSFVAHCLCLCATWLLVFLVSSSCVATQSGCDRVFHAFGFLWSLLVSSQDFAMRGLYVVKFGRGKIVAKKKYHDGTLSVPWWYRKCTIMVFSFRCGGGFWRIWSVFFWRGFFWWFSAISLSMGNAFRPFRAFVFFCFSISMGYTHRWNILGSSAREGCWWAARTAYASTPTTAKIPWRYNFCTMMVQ